MDDVYPLLERWSADAMFAYGELGNRSIQNLIWDTEVTRRYLARRQGCSEIMVICQDRYYQIVAMLAVWQLGEAVALPPGTHPHTLKMAAESTSLLVVHDTDFRGGARVQAILESGSAVESAIKPMPAEQVLVKLYTSGSTGSPSVHSKTVKQLLDEADLHIRLFSLPTGRALISTVPAHHIYGLLFGVLIPLRAGMPLERSTPLYATTLAARIREISAHTLVSTPVHLEHCGILRVDELNPIERVFCSGGPLPGDVAHQFCRSFQMSITELLGSTETGGIGWRLRHGAESEPPPWQTLPQVVVEADHDGGLLLDSPFVPANAERPMRCADRIFPIDKGHFEYRGRGDDIVKIGSKRFSRLELERTMRAIPGVRDVGLLVCDARGARGHVLEAAVVAPGWTVADLKKALGDCIDPVAVPRRIAIVSELPRDSTGKLPIAQLRRVLDHG